MIGDFKRGNAVLDTITFIVILFVFAILTYQGKMILNDFNTDFQADQTNTINESKQVLSDMNSSYPSMFDYGFLTLFVLMWILTLVASFVSDAHPIFFAVTIILMFFVFALSVYLGNIYEEIAVGDFASEYPLFPITHWIMTHLLQMSIAVGFSVALVLFAKSSR